MIERTAEGRRNVPIGRSALARQVPCPRCHARIGYPCHSGHKRIAVRPHKERLISVGAHQPQHGLRDLARQLREVTQRHPSYGQAIQIVTNCCDHLCAIARAHEANLELIKS